MAPLRSFIVGRYSALIAAVVLLAGIAIIGGVSRAENKPGPADAFPDGSQSAQAAELAAAAPDTNGEIGVILITSRDGDALSAADRQQITAALTGLAVPKVQGPLGGPQGIETSDDGTAVLASVLVTADGAEAVAPVVEDLREALKDAVPGDVRAEVTGPAAIQADLAKVFDGADFRLLIATATVVAILLILTYRSPVLWLIPLFVVGVADQVAAILGTQALNALDIAWDGSTTGILSVLVFGAGTNYALLLISRYRDELKLVDDRVTAMRTALQRTAESVIASAATVVVGVLCLTLSAFPTTRGLGLACALGILIAAFYALVALPAFLVLFGRWVFWPRRPEVGSATLSDGTSGWARVGRLVGAHPGRYTVGGIALLGVLASSLLGVSLGLPESEQFLKRPESIAAAERLAESFPAGRANTTTVWTKDPSAAAAVLERTEGVESARPGAESGAWSSFEVVLSDPPQSDDAQRTVADLRDTFADDNLDAVIGGTTAETLDTGDATSSDRLLLFPLIGGLVLLALGFLLRSVVAPILLVISVLATYGAALGAGWLVFQGPLDFSGVDDGMPLLAFLFLVALGVDYNIFLVTRIAEEIKHGHGPKASVQRALAATGGVITSAGVLLAAVFAVLGVLPLVVLAQLGVVICIGVLLDTLLVRTVLVPGLALLLGDRFWWPRRWPAHSAVADRPGDTVQV